MWKVLAAIIFLFALIKDDFVIIVLTDVHLELQYNSTIGPKYHCRNQPNINIPNDYTCALYGRHGCYSPYSLLKTTLEKMKQTNPLADFIILPGDLVTHYLPKINGTFDNKLYKKVKKTIKKHLSII